MLVEQIIGLREHPSAMRLLKQMIAPAEVSRSWMSVADDSVLYQSEAKFPRSIGIYRVSGLYRGRLDRVANSFVRCGSCVRPIS